MTTELQNESYELGNLRLRLRSDLSFELQEFAGAPCYVVKDATSSGYYQIGIAEYAFVSMLDGKTSLQLAVQETSYRLGESALTLRDAIGTCNWLIQTRLADPVDEQGVVGNINVENLLEQAAAEDKNKVVSQLNPLFIKMPMGDPSRFVRSLATLFGSIVSRQFFVLWTLVVCFAAYCTFQNSAQLGTASQGLFAPNAWLWLTATFVVMKIVHELAHGIFCHRLGGRVNETGLVFILCMPIPYVDVTSCWGFTSKWKRIAVSAAGMYIEIFFAALAAIAWSFSLDPVMKFHLFNIALTGTLTTLLFNANFLMRFDGYYILADWLEVPNLYQTGQQFLQAAGKRYFLGINAPPPSYPNGRALVIRAYGIGTFVWRIMICVSLSILASALFFGFGIGLAILGIAVWVGLPTWRFIKLIMAGNVRWSRLMFTVPAVGCLIAAMFGLPWPVQVSAPALVDYREPAIIRAGTEGCVTCVHVVDGQQVAAGDILFELENRQLTVELRQLEMDRQRSLVRSRGFHVNRQIAAYQAEVSARTSIEEQIEDTKRNLAGLTVRAPADGRVIADDLASWAGRHLREGSEILQIVDQDEKEIVFSVSQNDFDSFAAASLAPAIFVSTFSTGRCNVKIKTIEPNASTTCDIRLTSYAGGNLAVRPPAADSDGSDSGLQLLHPRFRGVVEVDQQTSSHLRAGTTGYIRLNQYSDSIAIHLFKEIDSWLRNCWAMTK